MGDAVKVALRPAAKMTKRDVRLVKTKGSPLGISVAEMARRTHWDDEGYGVIVGSVQPSSPARRQGLQAGDAILSIDGIPVTTHEQAAQMLREAHDSTTLTLTVRKGVL